MAHYDLSSCGIIHVRSHYVHTCGSYEPILSDHLQQQLVTNQTTGASQDSVSASDAEKLRKSMCVERRSRHDLW